MFNEKVDIALCILASERKRLKEIYYDFINKKYRNKLEKYANDLKKENANLSNTDVFSETLKQLPKILNFNSRDYEELRKGLSKSYSKFIMYNSFHSDEVDLDETLDKLLNHLTFEYEYFNKKLPLPENTVKYLTETLRDKSTTIDDQLKDLAFYEKKLLENSDSPAVNHIITALFKELNTDIRYERIKAEMLLEKK